MNSGIEIINISAGPVPTVCAPITAFRHLTTVSNAYDLGWYGFIAGMAATALFYVGAVYAAPYIIARLPSWVFNLRPR